MLAGFNPLKGRNRGGIKNLLLQLFAQQLQNRNQPPQTPMRPRPLADPYGGKLIQDPYTQIQQPQPPQQTQQPQPGPIASAVKKTQRPALRFAGRTIRDLR